MVGWVHYSRGAIHIAVIVDFESCYYSVPRYDSKVP